MSLMKTLIMMMIIYICVILISAHENSYINF